MALISWIVGAVVLVCALGWKAFDSWRRVVHVPLVSAGASGSSSLLELLHQGYQQYTRNNEIFKLKAPHGEQLVLPPQMLDELKNLPTSKISFAQSLQDQFFGRETLIGHHDPTLVASIREDLARNMSHVLDDLNDETEYALCTEVPSCQDWASFKVHRTVLRIVTLLSGRAFVGKELNRNEEFVHAATMYTIDSFVASQKLHATHPFLRPFGSWVVPEVGAVQRHLRTMKRLIKPLIEHQWRSQADGKDKFRNDMVTWNLKNSPASLRRNVDYQALQQLQATFAAVHTTAKLLTNILFDLAARPEYIQPLREELDEVLAADGGKLVKTSMPKLKKLDSFMAEVQRHNPPGIMTFNRTTMAPITLSSGLHLPKGTWLATATHPIANDPTIWDDPEKFDGFRFEKLCSQQGKSSKYQFVSTGHDMLMFGYGTQSCPGRFFVNNEIKIILAHLIENFDLALGKDNVRSKPVTGGVAFKPDPDQEVLIKRRM